MCVAAEPSRASFADSFVVRRPSFPKSFLVSKGREIKFEIVSF